LRGQSDGYGNEQCKKKRQVACHSAIDDAAYERSSTSQSSIAIAIASKIWPLDELSAKAFGRGPTVRLISSRP
jgi:hypothetical protein